MVSPDLRAALLASLLLAPALTASELTPQEERGKRIYFEGASSRGEPIEAFIGEDLTQIPAAVATCASCHGADGRGRPEAGVIPSDITWSYLFKPYGHRDPLDRRHPAFTEETLKDAILHGHDPAGNDLDSSMPLYLLSDADLEDLLAYMRKLETDLDPGLSGVDIRIGTVLPSQGPMAVLGEGIREVLSAYFEDVNAGGGIHGRHLALVESTYDNVRQSPLAETRRLVEEGEVFVLLSPVVAGADAEIGALAEDHRVPVIGPFTLFSPDPFTLNDYTFYLFSGLREQVRALVDFAAGELGLDAPKIAVVAPEDDRYRDVRAAVEEQCGVHGWAAEGGIEWVVGASEAAATAERLAERGVEVVLLLGPQDLGALLAAAEALGWLPDVLLPGAFASQAIFTLPAAFDKKVYLSYPTAPSDQTAAGIAGFQALLERHGSPLRHRAAQVSALVSARVLVEGLKGVGRDLSRNKLLRSLEKLYELETGLTPPLTFGANRRIGALGAYVVTVDLEKQDFIPVGGWITPK